MPLILLAIPSVVIGWLTDRAAAVRRLLRRLRSTCAEAHDVLGHMREEFHGPAPSRCTASRTPPFWLAFAGFAAAWFLYIKRPELPGRSREARALLYTLLVNKYCFDAFNESCSPAAAAAARHGLWGRRWALIDGAVVNGSARLVGWCRAVLRDLQSGYLYHYASR